jgi:hypothetical protein
MFVRIDRNQNFYLENLISNKLYKVRAIPVCYLYAVHTHSCIEVLLGEPLILPLLARIILSFSLL